MSDATYKVHGIGPVEGTISLTLKPGLNVLLGRNAEGKTTATNAVRRAGGDESVKLEKCDYSKKGWIEGPGLVVNVGSRTTAAGAATIEVSDYGRLHQILEPQGKTEKTRNKNRAGAILDLWPEPVSNDLLLKLADGNEEVAAAAQGENQGRELSLEQAAATVKKVAEIMARTREGEAGNLKETVLIASARHRELLSELAGSTPPTISSEQASAAFLSATRDLGNLQHRAELRQAREEERLRAAGGAEANLEGLDPSQIDDELLRQVLGSRPDREQALAVYRIVEDELAQARDTVQRLELDLAARKAEGKKIAEEAKFWNDRAAVLRQPVEGPVPAEVEEFQRQLERQEEMLEEIRMWEEARQLEQQKKTAVEQLAVEEAAGKIYRSIARNIAAVVNSQLQKLDFGGLRIDDDLGLSYSGPETGGEMIPFERLSAGQQARAVLLGAGLLRYPGRVMPVHPAWWWAIQPKRQKQLVALALEHDIKLVTEWPVDKKGLEVKHLGQEWVDTDSSSAITYLEKPEQEEAAEGDPGRGR